MPFLICVINPLNLNSGGFGLYGLINYVTLHGNIFTAGNLEEYQQRNYGGYGQNGGQSGRGAIAGADNLVINGN